MGEKKKVISQPQTTSKSLLTLDNFPQWTSNDSHQKTEKSKLKTNEWELHYFTLLWELKFTPILCSDMGWKIYLKSHAGRKKCYSSAGALVLQQNVWACELGFCSARCCTETTQHSSHTIQTELRHLSSSFSELLYLRFKAFVFVTLH